MRPYPAQTKQQKQSKPNERGCPGLGGETVLVGIQIEKTKGDQWIKALAAKLSDLSSVLGTHMLDRENTGWEGHLLCQSRQKLRGLADLHTVSVDGSTHVMSPCARLEGVLGGK